MGTAPASAREALNMVRAGLDYLAAADPAQLPTATQAEFLRELEQADAIATATRASFLAVFTARQLPNAEPLDLPGLTHLLHAQNPAAVADGLTGFFARHPILQPH